MGDNGSSAELTTEAVELSKGMLGIIGAYGMSARADVRDMLEASSPAPARERVLVSAAGYTSDGVSPKKG